jgi:hypothetical protein
MKTHNPTRALLGLLCTGAILFSLTTNSFAAPKPAAAAPAQDSADGGRLVITRSPTLGTGVFVSITVDGKKVGSFGVGKKYDTMLSPGNHTLSAILDPNLTVQQPFTTEITVVKGQTYGFTSVIKSGKLVLKRNK